MNLSDAIQSIIKPHEKDTIFPLKTIWGEQLDTEHILCEYPRPQMERSSFLNLNGYWNYAFTLTSDIPKVFDGRILVPFSPEASLSGVNRQLQPNEFLWYESTLPIEQDIPESMRLLLHFGAIDYSAEVFINGHSVISHVGGYLPFEVDITEYIHEADNHILIKVQDTTDVNSQARGKQTLHRGGIFYTAQSGIWQTVWLEWVPASYMKSLHFETDYDNRTVTAYLTAISESSVPPISLSVFSENKEIVKQVFQLTANASTTSAPQYHTVNATLSFTIPEEDFHSWSPETPFLYNVTLAFGSDHIKSYFALRLFTIERKDKLPVFCLNHKPYFLMGVLDQGYWPDGLYTAPSDEALLYDITTMKDLGFNMIRKHIKVESARWYYHCDRIGMIVCQDMVNGGSSYHMPVISYFPTLFPGFASHMKDSHSVLLSRRDAPAKAQWEKEALETVSYLKFFPSIAIWVPFNEGWGQFDTARITNLIQQEDSGRLIDSASGWFDQKCGDFVSVHNYFRPLRVSVRPNEARAFFLSEYGGFACHVKGHSSVDRIFGYKRYDTIAEFQEACHALIHQSLLPLQKQGLCGAVFTQLSDVEEEVNGILTYDRKVRKLEQRLF